MPYPLSSSQLLIMRSTRRPPPPLLPTRDSTRRIRHSSLPQEFPPAEFPFSSRGTPSLFPPLLRSGTIHCGYGFSGGLGIRIRDIPYVLVPRALHLLRVLVPGDLAAGPFVDIDKTRERSVCAPSSDPLATFFARGSVIEF